jgi:hypothetical protein
MEVQRNIEIERNFQYFLGKVADLLPSHAGQYALLRNQSVVEIFPSVLAAVNAGHTRFDDDLFSIQEVVDRPLDLGFYSHANTDRGLLDR